MDIEAIRKDMVRVIENYLPLEMSNEICICLEEVVRIIKRKDRLLYEAKKVDPLDQPAQVEGNAVQTVQSSTVQS